MIEPRSESASTMTNTTEDATGRRFMFEACPSVPKRRQESGAGSEHSSVTPCAVLWQEKLDRGISASQTGPVLGTPEIKWPCPSGDSTAEVSC